MRAPGRMRAAAAALVVLAAVSVGCGGDPARRADVVATGDGGVPSAGRDAIVDHGCGACHRIPGVPNANADVGPPLDGWSRRTFIAGNLPNSQPNLSAWITDPQAVEPGTAMPTLDLTEQEVADIVAYLFTLD